MYIFTNKDAYISGQLRVYKKTGKSFLSDFLYHGTFVSRTDLKSRTKDYDKRLFFLVLRNLFTN